MIGYQELCQALWGWGATVLLEEGSECPVWPESE